MLLVVIVWVVFLSALACAVALVRDTTGHDWYGTGKLFVTQLMIGIGFDDSVETEYRNWRGEVESLTRADLIRNADARVARAHLLRTARKAAELGACCGLGGALMCLAPFGRQGRRRTGRLAHEPVMSIREPPGYPPDPSAQRPPGPEPAGARDAGKGAGKIVERRKRRKRNYERWI